MDDHGRVLTAHPANVKTVKRACFRYYSKCKSIREVVKRLFEVDEPSETEISSLTHETSEKTMVRCTVHAITGVRESDVASQSQK